MGDDFGISDTEKTYSVILDYDNSIFFARFTKPEKGGFYIEMDGEYLSLFENDSGEKPLMIFARTNDYD